MPDLDTIAPETDEELLSDDTIEKEEVKEEEEEEEIKEEEDEEEIKKEDKEKDEDEEEDEENKKPDIPFDRPTITDIKAKYPEFFKEFPSLKEAFFREVEFTKLFPTIEDAKEAFEDNEAFTTLSDSALSGDPIPLLESIEKTDKKAFETFSLSFLPALYKRDQDVYSSVVTPLFENLVRQIYKSSTDENVRNTAINVADFLFGDKNGELVVKGEKTFSKSVKPTEEQARLKSEREETISKQFRAAYTHVETEINKSLKYLVLKDFDPNQVFTKFMRNNLADEVIKRIKKQLESDEGHKAVMGSRWKRAKGNGYTDDDKSKIISTFLARAKSLIPVTRDKVRAAALGTKEKQSNKTREQRAPVEKESHGGRPSSNGRSERVDYKKMSDMDILNS